jgi:hypothetical protein
VQYAQMPRNSRLVDLDSINEIIDRLLTIKQRLDNVQAYGVD